MFVCGTVVLGGGEVVAAGRVMVAWGIVSPCRRGEVVLLWRGGRGCWAGDRTAFGRLEKCSASSSWCTAVVSLVCRLEQHSVGQRPAALCTYHAPVRWAHAAPLPPGPLAPTTMGLLLCGTRSLHVHVLRPSRWHECGWRVLLYALIDDTIAHCRDGLICFQGPEASGG